MAWYIAESYEFSVDHGGRESQGVVGDHKGSEKLYLHVLSITDDEIARLRPRVDDDGNTQHARLALPRNDAWWIATEGEAAWPNLHRPRLVSRCDLGQAKPRPVPLSADDLARLAKAGVRGI